MAVDNSYPSGLPNLIRDNARQTVGRFRDAEVNQGPAFTETISRDTPTTMDRQLFLTRGQALMFETWLRQSTAEQAAPIDGGSFLIDVLTPYGLQTQECRFLSPAPQPSGNYNAHIQYNFSLIIREYNIGLDLSDGSDDAIELLELAEISPHYDPLEGMQLVDISINEDLP